MLGITKDTLYNLMGRAYTLLYVHEAVTEQNIILQGLSGTDTCVHWEVAFAAGMISSQMRPITWTKSSLGKVDVNCLRI